MYDLDDSLNIWVSDLDEWINVDFSSDHEAEREKEILHEALEEIGEIPLFAQKFVSSWTLNSRGISPENWRWSLHEAQKAIGDSFDRHEIERRFLKKLIDMGRGYAIRRYAKWEKLPYPSALTAVLPHGIRALLYNYVDAEPSLRDPSTRPALQSALLEANKAMGLTAYDRTATIRRALNDSASRSRRVSTHPPLDKRRTRMMLSLFRLHFSAQEINVDSLSELEKIEQLYCAARCDADNDDLSLIKINGRKIRNWRKRHLYPLTYLFPWSFRGILSRGYRHCSQDLRCSYKDCAINELALAQCGLKLLRQRAIERWRTG